MNHVYEIDDLDMLEVEVLNEGTDSIPEALGISDERDKELQKITTEAFIEEETITGAMVKISEEVIHPNELAYCCFKMGAMRERMSHDPLFAAAIAARNEKKKKEEQQQADAAELVFEEDDKAEEEDLNFDD